MRVYLSLLTLGLLFIVAYTGAPTDPCVGSAVRILTESIVLTTAVNCTTCNNEGKIPICHRGSNATMHFTVACVANEMDAMCHLANHFDGIPNQDFMGITCDCDCNCILTPSPLSQPLPVPLSPPLPIPVSLPSPVKTPAKTPSPLVQVPISSSTTPSTGASSASSSPSTKAMPSPGKSPSNLPSPPSPPSLSSSPRPSTGSPSIPTPGCNVPQPPALSICDCGEVDFPCLPLDCLQVCPYGGACDMTLHLCICDEAPPCISSSMEPSPSPSSEAPVDCNCSNPTPVPVVSTPQTPSIPTCGNGCIDANEQCDSSEFCTEGCTLQRPNETCSVLTCDPVPVGALPDIITWILQYCHCADTLPGSPVPIPCPAPVPQLEPSPVNVSGPPTTPDATVDECNDIILEAQIICPVGHFERATPGMVGIWFIFIVIAALLLLLLALLSRG